MSAADRARQAAERDRQKAAAGVDKPNLRVTDDEVGVRPLGAPAGTLAEAAAEILDDGPRVEEGVLLQVPGRPLQTTSPQDADVDGYEAELRALREKSAPLKSLGMPEAPGLQPARQSYPQEVAEQRQQSRETALATEHTDVRRATPGEPVDLPLVTRVGPTGALPGLPKSGTTKR